MWQSHELKNIDGTLDSVLHEGIMQAGVPFNPPTPKTGFKRDKMLMLGQGDTCRVMLFDVPVAIT